MARCGSVRYVLRLSCHSILTLLGVVVLVHGFGFFLCFCFFSVGLWFLRVGYGAIGFIGSVWVGFCIVGAGHLVRFGSDCFGFVVCVCWVVGNWFN